ncbi:MAG TPA: hypothetical protein VHX44_14635, partial [Planctomycetota bacterium]|nr:hypothetical protein [Planctomycetota bacterium]
MSNPSATTPPAGGRRWAIFAVWGLATLVIGVLAAKANYSPDLRGMLPANDPAFVHELDFYARQGATRVLALEAAGDPAACHAVLAKAVTALAAMDVTPLDGGGAGAVARAGEVMREHLPVLATPELLHDIEANLGREHLDAYLKAFKERALRPEDAFTASAARRDLLAITGRLMQPLMEGFGGSERDGQFMRHADGRHLLAVFQVPFDPQLMSRTAPLMALVDGIMADAKSSGVTLEAIGAYRHFRDNLAAVYSDLNSSMPLAIVLIGLVLYSLIPNLRALTALHIPAVIGMAGGVAAVVALGLDVPLPLLGFAAGMLGVAVDYGQHVVVAIRSGESAHVWRPLLTTWITTASAFAVLITSSVPGIRCVGIMVVIGLGIALLASLTLLPRLTPKLKPVDHWLRISIPLLEICQRRPLINWVIASLVTTALLPKMLQLRFNDNLKSYDGSRPETWAALNDFLTRWGSISSSDFLVSQDDQLGTALDAVKVAREKVGYPPSFIERLLPGPQVQAERLAAWNTFWKEHAESFAADLTAAAATNGLRVQAFSETLALYQPATTVPPLTFASWKDSALEPLASNHVMKLADGRWQVASPVDKLTRAECDRVHQVLKNREASSPVWLASREHISATLVSMITDDLAKRSIAI